NGRSCRGVEQGSSAASGAFFVRRRAVAAMSDQLDQCGGLGEAAFGDDPMNPSLASQHRSPLLAGKHPAANTDVTTDEGKQLEERFTFGSELTGACDQ